MPAPTTTTTKSAPAARGAASSPASKSAASAGHKADSGEPSDALVALMESKLTPPTSQTETETETEQEQETESEGQTSQVESPETEAETTESSATATEAAAETDATATEQAAAEEAEEAEPAAKAAEEADKADKVPPGVQKRFDEMTAKIHDLKRQLEEAKPATASPAARAGSPIEQMVAECATPAALTALTERLQELEDEAIAKRDGGEFKDSAGNVQELDAAQVTNLLLNARRALRQVPARLAALAALRESDVLAREAYPAFADAESPESTAYAALLREHPALGSVPGLKLLVADAALGRKAREAKAATGKSSLPGRPVVRAPGQPAALPSVSVRRPAPANARDERRVAAHEKAKQSGTINDLTELMAAKMAA